MLLRVAAVQIRDSIKSLFPDRDCHTLVRPMHDERALNHLDSLEPNQLRPEFSEVSSRPRGSGGTVCCVMWGGRKTAPRPNKLPVCTCFVASVCLRMRYVCRVVG